MIDKINVLKALFEEAEAISLALSKLTRKLIGLDEKMIETLVEKTMQTQIKEFRELGVVSSGI